MTEATPTVFLVDDEPQIRRAMMRLLRAAGYNVEAYESAKAFTNMYNPAVPGCLVLDLVMPEADGLALQEMLHAAGAKVPIVFLSGHGDIPATVRAIKAGAIDFLTKPVKDTVLLQAIDAAMAKDRSLRKAQIAIAESKRRLATLTQREREVLSFVIVGKLNKEIAAELGTVEKTIKVHRARMMRKMGMRSVAELVRVAERLGINAEAQHRHQPKAADWRRGPGR